MKGCDWRDEMKEGEAACSASGPFAYLRASPCWIDDVAVLCLSAWVHNSAESRAYITGNVSGIKPGSLTIGMCLIGSKLLMWRV